jgi:glutathione S-transferase
MILIGMFDSPYVRRVAVSMQWLGIPFEHRDWSVGKDFDRIREFNPLGRVPTLVLDDGEVLADSVAILDYLDERVGPARALLPTTGPRRRAALQIMALATGAADKAVLQIYESAFRPAEKRHEPWLDRCRLQVRSALAALERKTLVSGPRWLLGDEFTQADVTLGCVLGFLYGSVGVDPERREFPGLAAFAIRCEQSAAFCTVPLPEFFVPGPAAG